MLNYSIHPAAGNKKSDSLGEDNEWKKLQKTRYRRQTPHKPVPPTLLHR